LDHFSYRNGPIDLVRGLFSNKTLGHTAQLLWGLCVPFWVHLGVPA
jgi:hypothetical protein